MKKCPSCYAYMRESTPVPDSTPEASAAMVRYQCGQCGHMEQSFAKAAPALR